MLAQSIVILKVIDSLMGAVQQTMTHVVKSCCRGSELSNARLEDSAAPTSFGR